MVSVLDVNVFVICKGGIPCEMAQLQHSLSDLLTESLSDIALSVDWSRSNSGLRKVAFARLSQG